MEEKEKRETRVSSPVMELRDLISAPLLATVDADSLSASRYLKNLLDIGFESVDAASGKLGKVKMLSFQCPPVSGRRGTQRISIPLLSLVPLPLLQVHQADFDFDIQVLDASVSVPENEFLLKGSKEGLVEGSVERNPSMRVSLVSGSYRSGNGGSQQRQSSVNANMKVHVKMGQADFPAGLSVLLNKAVNGMVEDVLLEDGAHQEGPEDG